MKAAFNAAIRAALSVSRGCLELERPAQGVSGNAAGGGFLPDDFRPVTVPVRNPAGFYFW